MTTLLWIVGIIVYGLIGYFMARAKNKELLDPREIYKLRWWEKIRRLFLWTMSSVDDMGGPQPRDPLQSPLAELESSWFREIRGTTLAEAEFRTAFYIFFWPLRLLALGILLTDSLVKLFSILICTLIRFLTYSEIRRAVLRDKTGFFALKEHDEIIFNSSSFAHPKDSRANHQFTNVVDDGGCG